MYRGTTPKISFHIIDDINFSSITEIWFTLDNKEITYTWKLTTDKVKINSENKLIYVELTQEESLSLIADIAFVQLRVLMNDGQAYASRIKPIKIHKILKDGIISIEEEEPVTPDPDPVDPDPAG